MSFINSLSTIGSRTLARTIAAKTAETYIQTQRKYPEKTKDDLLKETFARLDFKAAQELLCTEEFWDDKESPKLSAAIYSVVVDSSPINRKRLLVPENHSQAYTEEIQRVLEEYGLSDE